MISDIVFAKMRKLRLAIERLQLDNRECTIIADNCLAGMLYHDYGMRFNSPTINTFIHAYDYNLFLKYLLDREDISYIEEVPSCDGECPKGLINGKVRIDFTHYDTFEEGARKWKERVKRIDYDNMYIIMTEKSVRSELVEEFCELPFAHKLALVHKPYPGLKDTSIIKGFEKEGKLGYIFGKYKWWGMNYYDQVDWVNFLNER